MEQDKPNPERRGTPPPQQQVTNTPINFSASFTITPQAPSAPAEEKQKRPRKKKKNESISQQYISSIPGYQHLNFTSSSSLVLPPILENYPNESWQQPVPQSYTYPQQYIPQSFRIINQVNPYEQPIAIPTQQIPVISNHPQPSPTHVTTVITSTSYSSGRFVLLEHPSGRQIIGANKFLSPNPIVLIQRESQPGEILKPIVWGICAVQIVGKDGEFMDNVHLSSTDGTTKELSKESTFSFSLRATAETSRKSVGKSVFLRFSIKYILQDQLDVKYEEVVQSRGFVLVSQKRQGRCIALKPNSGPSSSSTEVWIRGENFPERVTVSFGGINAEVVAVDPNLIVVQTPIYPMTMDIEQVEVEVRDEAEIPITGELHFSFHKM